MATFFENQIDAKRKTKLLLFYFVSAVVMIIVVIYLFLAAFLHKGQFFQPELFFAVCAATVVVISLGSLYKIFLLRSGGKVVAESLGGRLILRDTGDPTERKILNVVEEMSLASGLPVPPVYLLEESGINAFAAGYRLDNAVIGITRGCINLLTRDELQGVIAHEFSHILNGDMRLNIRLIGVLHGILIIGMSGYILLRSSLFSRYRRSSNADDKGRWVGVSIGLVLFLVGYIGVFFGKLIKAAVSRQREFLADASAVQYTRNPDGISGALKKIGGFAHGSQIQSEKAEETSHLFFGEALSRRFFSLFATHPPLSVRIQAIDPRFDENFPMIEESYQSAHTTSEEQLHQGFTSQDTYALDAESITEQIGTVNQESIDAAQKLIETLPLALKQGVRSTEQVWPVIFGLLLDSSEETQAKQLELTPANLLKHEDIKRYAEMIQKLDREYQLPIIELALPTLKQTPPDQYAEYKQLLSGYVNADGEISLFEYMLHHVLRRHIELPSETPRRRSHQTDLTQYAFTLLSCFADYAGSDKDQKSTALKEGLDVLGIGEQAESYIEDRFSLNDFDEALTELEFVDIGIKEKIIVAMTKVIAKDGYATCDEREMLRACCDALGCPMPLMP